MNVLTVDLGRGDYEETWMLQHRVHRARCEGGLPDSLLLVEHPPVLTTGSSGKKESLLVSEAFLRDRGIPCHTVERGGDLTYHGPGQLVCYPIFGVGEGKRGILELVQGLEEVMILALKDYGLAAERNRRNRGVWMGEEKVGFVGIAVRGGVSFHGFALNVDPDLSFFHMIHPCGLQGVRAVSMASLLGRSIAFEEVKERVLFHLEKVFEVVLEREGKEDFLSRLEAADWTQGRGEGGQGPRKPHWLKRRLPARDKIEKVHGLLRECRLHTVCQSALCPNLGECFSEGTSTFMILGDCCTRNCRFCAVGHGRPDPPDQEEPERVARAVKELGLKYAVITSVTRDDLPDGGAAHFASTIRAIRAHNPGVRIEVLIPDFQGSPEALERVVEAAPDVINHNIETVPRLYPEVRPQADYARSLELLSRVRDMDPKIPTKSGIMLGLGEGDRELEETLGDLLRAGCRILTLGQYLAPSKTHHPVIRYVPPEEFEDWERKAYRMGFQAVASGPFVRSSYHAGEMCRTAGSDPP